MVGYVFGNLTLISNEANTTLWWSS